MISVVLKMAIPCFAMFLLSYLTSTLVIKRNVKKHTYPIPESSSDHKSKIGVMDTVLVIEGIAIVIYVVVDFLVFWHTGSEPSALTMGFFAVCGGENGAMAWIKTQKEQERLRKWQLEDEDRMQDQTHNGNNNEGDETL